MSKHGFKALAKKIEKKNRLKKIKLELLERDLSEGRKYFIDEEKGELWTFFGDVALVISEVLGKKWDSLEDKVHYTRYVWQLSKILEEAKTACSQRDSDSGSGLSDCGYPAATTLVQTETGSGPEEGML